MSLSPEWIDYQSRSIDVRELIISLVSKVNTTDGTSYRPESVYEDNDWGAFESAYLYKALIQMTRENTLWDKDQILSRFPISSSQRINDSSVFVDEGDEYEPETPDVLTRSLNWFKSAAPERIIRDTAKDEYEQRLLALYVEHVESTGETFYPELQSILENQFDFQGDS